MYVVNSTKWDATRLSGQERLVVDAWLEAVSDDCDPVCWPPIFSTFQLIRNLLSILEDVVASSLKTYHVKHASEEILVRLDEGTWLDEAFPFDIPFLKEKLRWVKERTKDTADDVRARSEMASYLRAFINKVEVDQPWQWQRQLLTTKTVGTASRFQVLVRAVVDFINELMHQEHSRAHLNRWILRQVVSSSGPRTYVDMVRNAPGLFFDTRQTFEVLFQVASPVAVMDSASVRFFPTMPANWALDPTSLFLRDARSRFAVVRVTSARDRYAAIVHARAVLSRYLWSMKFHHVEFDRAISKHAAVRELGATSTYEEPHPRTLDHRSLWNHDTLESVVNGSHNLHTYAALERILYWIEQTRRVEPIAALISEWTALEFLFTVPGLSDLDAVERFLPAYLAINYPRWLLLDFWRFLQHTRPEFPPALIARIDIRSTGRHSRATCNLTELLKVCLEDETTNPIKPLIDDYPILVAKWRRLRRLRPGDRTLAEDVDAFVQRLHFDIRTCYRARNTVVHDAAMVISENERLLQRLNWMLCASVDQILFQFGRNSAIGMVDIHRCNHARWEKWREVIGNTSTPCNESVLVEPPAYFLR